MPTYAPCKNPNCPKRGQSHPNCHCYSGVSTQRLDKAGLERPGTTGQPIGSIGDQSYAEGGTVTHHCPDCKYMADGGQITPAQPQQLIQDDPSETLGHAAIHGGLLGLLQNAGHSDLADFKPKHTKMLDDLKQGKQQDLTGPLTGQISQEKLKPIINRLSVPIGRDSDPAAFRSGVNYLHTAMKGDDKLNDYTEGLLGLKKENSIKPDPKVRDKLKEHLSDLEVNPEKALNVGGNLGHYLPAHGIQLAALTAQASNYLNAIKPMNTSTGPFGESLPPSKSQQDAYHRQLDIAEQPLMVLEHVKTGRLLAKDMTTLTTLYPSLYQKMLKTMNDGIITAKSQKKEIPYQRKLSLSLFMGQPLDVTMGQPLMQAAIMANAPKGPPQPPQGSKKPSKPSNAQNQKEAEMFQTNTQARDSKNPE